MWHDFAARPVYRFNEKVIMAVFRYTRDVAGTLILHTARDLDRGAICILSTSDVQQALIEAVKKSSPPRPGGSRWRYWRYLPLEEGMTRLLIGADLGDAIELRELAESPRSSV